MPCCCGAISTVATRPTGLATSVSGAALAGATTGGTWAAAGIFLMKTKTIILGAVAVLAVGVALFQFKQAQDAEILLAIANRDRDALREPLRGSRPVAVTVAEKESGAVRPGRAAQATPSGMTAVAGNAQTPPIIAKVRNVNLGRIQSLDSQYQPLYRGWA